MGIVSISYPGSSIAARTGASLLHALEMDELIANSIEEYEQLAVTLAQDPQLRSQLRSKIAKKRTTAPLFDTKRWVRNFERGLKEIWNNYLEGLPPKHVFIKE
jgi:protein O-GlcNAc transferase